MNATQALSRLRKKLGKRAILRDTGGPSSPEQRAAASAKRKEANEARSCAEAAMNARATAVLAADADYQRLRAIYAAARDTQRASPFGGHYRYSTGTVVHGLFFSVAAEADTLAELVEKVEAKP